MRIINFGSLNIDKVYQVEQFVRPGQTITAKDYAVAAGGKGLNQSLAAARAGAEVLHAGAIGAEGRFMADLLRESGADTSLLREVDGPSGHAVIEINAAGQNRIIVFGGANRSMTSEYIERVLDASQPDDWVLLQNEVNLVPEIIRRAHEKELRVVFNPSPVPENTEKLLVSKGTDLDTAQQKGEELSEYIHSVMPQKLSEKLEGNKLGKSLSKAVKFTTEQIDEAVKALSEGGRTGAEYLEKNIFRPIALTFIRLCVFMTVYVLMEIVIRLICVCRELFTRMAGLTAANRFAGMRLVFAKAVCIWC